MSNFNRIIPRKDTYGNWNIAATGVTPLYLAEGEMAIVLADSASAVLGLSNPSNAPQAGPPTQRKPNFGEFLYIKIGLGTLVPWQGLPVLFPDRKVNIPDGRTLGTRNNGANHVYANSVDAIFEILKPIYTAPEGSMGLTTGGTLSPSGFIQGASAPNSLYEVGETVVDVYANVLPVAHSFSIVNGQVYEVTLSNVAIGSPQIGTASATIAQFSRLISNKYTTSEANSLRDNSQGLFYREFNATLTDTGPNPQGVASVFTTNTPFISAVYPEYIGTSTIDITGLTPAQRGAFVTGNLQRLLKGRSPINGGAKYSIVYGSTPEWFYYAIPATFFTGMTMLDALNANQYNESGAYPPSFLRDALVTVNGRYSGVAYKIIMSREQVFNSTIQITIFPS